MKSYSALLFIVLSAPAVSSERLPSPSPTGAYFSRFYIETLRDSAREENHNGAITDAEERCISEAPLNSLGPEIEAALANDLTEEEMAVADAFFRTSAGTKFSDLILNLLRTAGELPPGNEGSQAEVEAANAFLSSPTGKKIMDFANGGPARTVVTSRLEELWRHCVSRNAP